MTFSTNTDYKTGDNILYNGEKGTIKSSSAGSNYAWIEVNGKEKLVNLENVKTYGVFSSGLSDDVKEYLAENKQKIKGFKQDWNIGKELKWSAIDNLGSFWRKLGFTRGSFDKLNDKQLAEYNTYKEQRSAGIAQMHAASNGVHSTVNESLRAIYSCC